MEVFFMSCSLHKIAVEMVTNYASTNCTLNILSDKYL